MECTDCKYRKQIALKRCKHFELGGDKKRKVTKPTCTCQCLELTAKWLVENACDSVVLKLICYQIYLLSYNHMNLLVRSYNLKSIKIIQWNSRTARSQGLFLSFFKNKTNANTGCMYCWDVGTCTANWIQ